MTRLRLTLACGDYDRTRALHDGAIVPEGIELVCLRLPVEDIFFRMARFAEFDAAELSLSSYLLSMTDDGPGRFVAIPAFLSRSFRHSGIYVNQTSGIARPEDLVGRTVGLAEYQLTANVWIRGLLAEHHGVPVASVRYRTGGGSPDSADRKAQGGFLLAEQYLFQLDKPERALVEYARVYEQIQRAKQRRGPAAADDGRTDEPLARGGSSS